MNIVVVYGGICRNTVALSDTFRPSALHCFELTSRTKYLDKKFKIVRRKKTRRYIDDSRDEDQISAVNNQLIEPIKLEPVEPVVLVAVPIAESIAEPITQLAPKKRASKPKKTDQIGQTASQMGRPPLARDALQISPRRSSRLKK